MTKFDLINGKQYKIVSVDAANGGGEMRYVEEAFRQNWIVPLGRNLDAFEREFTLILGWNKYIFDV